MFEIEKKVKLSQGQVSIIEKRASFLREEIFSDTYFDSKEFSYTTKNIWLRKREGSFQLKVGIKKENGAIDRYEEITESLKIKKFFEIDSDKDLSKELRHLNILPFCTFKTHRKKYLWDGVSVDLDSAFLDDLSYCIGEFEIQIADKEQIFNAEEKLSQMLERIEAIPNQIIPAKLTYFLFHKKPDHYQALLNAKVIQPFPEKS